MLASDRSQCQHMKTMRIPLLSRQSYLTGFDPRTLLKTLRSVPFFLRSIRQYSRMKPGPNFQITLSDLFPILTDLEDSAGSIGGHYFHQDLWAARKIRGRMPEQHIDIGSRIDGFITHLLVFMPVTVVDIRPIKSTVSGLTFFQDDATELARFPTGSVDSLSTLNVAEHFGLGRYSDPVDPNACFRFMKSLERVLAPNGRLYFSVPCGRERVEFNAHRVFSPQTVVDSFPGLQLVSFSAVGDDGNFYQDAEPAVVAKSEFSCGLFEFTKAAGE
jgi:hypothetical protein